MDEPQAEKRGGERRGGIRSYVALALVAVAAVMLVAWLVSDDGDSSESASAAPEIVSAAGLRDAAAELDIPIYWAGERQATELELSRSEADRVYVRYLTDGAKAGDQRADFLTVGTYAFDDPVAALRRQSKETGGVLGTAPGDATVYFDRGDPRSVYLAFPGVDAQIEVYDPNFKQALQLVNSGQIVASN
jgi:hypothetical protein